MSYGWQYWEAFKQIWGMSRHSSQIPMPNGSFDECWSFKAPKIPSGPDPDGWGDFVVGYVFREGSRFLAYPFGCEWKKDDKGEWQRTWNPSERWFRGLRNAMEWCETEFLRTGLILPTQKGRTLL